MLPPALQPESSALFRVVGEGRTKQLLRVMKLTAIILLTACLTAGAKGYSQITLTAKNAPLHKVFKEIQRQSGFDFFYNYELIEQAGSVTVNVYDVPLEKAIEECLKGKGLTYEIISRTVVIKKKETTTISADKFSSAIDVRGRVTNQSGEPVEGASVVVKGTNNGTTTNSEGYFELKNVDENASLVITGTNIETIEVRVDGRTVLAIKAVIKIEAQEEVVINAGYYKVTDKEKTGSISRVDSRVIERQPISNPLQALQGRMTGVYIQQRVGAPGGGFNVEVRGRNSLRNGSGGTINGNLPFYVVDGVPYTSTVVASSNTTNSNLLGGNPLVNINPNDIESVEVLKDADATAIYGSRGANGVILITTKRGQAGKTKVDFNFYRGIGKVSNRMNLLKTPQYLEMRREAIDNDGYTSLLSDPTYDIYFPDLKIWDTTRYTDWQKTLTGGTADITNAQLSMSWGNKQTQFLVSGSYYRETTVFPDEQALSRATGRINMTHQSINDRFKADVSVTFTETNNKQSLADLMFYAISLPPNAPSLYNEQGNLNWEDGTWTNPLSFLRRPFHGLSGTLVSNAVLSYQLIKGLTLKTSLGYTSLQSREKNKTLLSSFSPTDVINYGLTGSMLLANNYLRTWIVEPQIDYSFKLENSRFQFTAGLTFQEDDRGGETIEGTGYNSDALINNILAAPVKNILSTVHSNYRYNAAYGRIHYDYKGKYLLNITARRDGSNRFGPGNRFGNFGAVGVGWIFSRESFMKNSASFINFGKVRASYGITGNDVIGDFQYLTTYTAANPYAGQSSLTLTRLGNPDYSWESNRKLEAAVELSFFKDRIQFSSAVYRNRSTNQLVGLPLPLLTGQSSVQFNFPATVENKGFEFELSTKNIERKNLKWSTSFNLSFPRNELISFPEIEKFPAFASRYEVGKSVYIFRGLQFIGVDPQNGGYTFKDMNGDGLITALDNVGLKEVNQQFFGGITNSVSIKGITLDIFLQYVKQSGFIIERSFVSPGSMNNQPDHVVRRWRQSGDIATVQRYTMFDPAGTLFTAFSRYINSDASITDASFVRIKNVSLSYQFPDNKLQKAKLRAARIFLQGQNLLTITKYKGLDPENYNAQYLPPLRVLTAGLQLSL